MRVDQAFRKCGFEIVSTPVKGESSLSFDVRVPIDVVLIPERWTKMLSNILPAAENVAARKKTKWGIDIAKRFFSKNGAVRYLWRVQMTGDLAAASVAVVAACLDSLRTGHELTEVPLVGAQTPSPDPANGRFKGGYRRGEEDQASHHVARAFSVG